MPIFDDETERYLGRLLEDEAVMAADTILMTVPNQLGAQFNARIFEVLARDIKPALGADSSVH